MPTKDVLNIIKTLSSISILELDTQGNIKHISFNSNGNLNITKGLHITDIFSIKEKDKVLRILSSGTEEARYLKISKTYSKGIQYVNINIQDLKGKTYAYLIPEKPKPEEIEYENQLHELAQKAETDQLTGLLNRHGYWERVKRILNCGDSARRIGIVFLDIDHLTEINTDLGHKGGDKAITQLSNLILNHLRTRDIAVRYGGDEFVIVVEELSGRKSTAYGLANRILRELNKNRSKYLTTLSIGVHVVKVGKIKRKNITDIQLHRNWDEQVVIADRMAYKAKTLGRNTVVFSKKKTKSVSQ